LAIEMKKQSYLIGISLLAIVASVALFLLWSENGETEPALAKGHESAEGGIDLSDLPDQESGSSRIEIESSEKSTTGAEDPGDPGRGRSDPLGWLVTGRVALREGDPIAAAKVSLHYWGLPDMKMKGRAVRVSTDEAGSYQAFVAVPDRISSRDPSRSFPGLIAGRADAAGFRPAKTDSKGGLSSTNHPSTFHPLLPPPMSSAMAHSVRVDFVLEAGSVIGGRVVTADGVPVAAARVNVKNPDQDWHFGAATSEDGIYSIPIDCTGEHKISAEKRGVGVARAISFSADVKRDVELPDIILVGGDCLAGVVVFPDGTPIEGVEIYASMKKPAKKRNRAVCIEEALTRNRDASFENLLGCTQGEALTDSEGSFIIKGLNPGQYEVQPRYPNEFHGTDEWSISHLEQVHDSGASDIRFVLPIHVLHARMCDDAGRPLPGTMFFQIDFAVGELVAGDVMGEETSSGVASMQVVPGKWTVWGFSNSRQPTKKTMTVGEKDYESTVDLVLPALDLSGALRLTVKGSDGRPISQAGLTLFTAKPRAEGHGIVESDWPLLRENLSSGSGEYEFPVPPGSFYVVVSSRNTSTVDGVVYPFAFHHWVSFDDVAIEPGKVTHLPVTLEQGGLVRLTLHFDRSGTKFFRVNLDAYDELRERKIVYIPFAATGSADRIRPREMESGVPYLGQKLLRPGPHRLEVEARGHPKRFKKTEIHFTILPGKVTDVEAWIEEE